MRLRAGGNATVPEFIALAERLSGEDLDAFFEEWLFSAAKPASLPAAAGISALRSGGRAMLPGTARHGGTPLRR